MKTDNKIRSRKQIRADSIEFHKWGRSFVLCTGIFDCLHIGHLSLLEYASEFGNVFVGVNGDEAARLLKGDGRPINNEAARARLIAGLVCVHSVFVIDEKRVTKTILDLHPTHWCKGSDYTLETLDVDEREAAKEVDACIIFAPRLEGYSSTKIIERLKG